MGLITLASATGSPGVTTTALGLALHWPGDVLLVDADRDPAQALQAGYLRGIDMSGRGIGALARAHREHRSIAEEAWLQTVRIDDGSGVERRFLPGFTHPAAAGLFAPVWGECVEALGALEDSGTDVLVDAGRLGPGGLPAPLVAGSDQILLCVRSSLRALAALRLHLGALQAQVEATASSTQLSLLVIGAGRPYSAREISKQFDIPVAHSIAWEPRQAEVFSDGATPPRSLGGGALPRSLRACASQLAEELGRRRALVAGDGIAAGDGAVGGSGVTAGRREEAPA